MVRIRPRWCRNFPSDGELTGSLLFAVILRYAAPQQVTLGKGHETAENPELAGSQNRFSMRRDSTQTLRKEF
jgi:hypothetical protein